MAITDDKILDRIFMITERMIVFDGLDDVFEHIVKTAVALTHAEAASIRVFNIETGTLDIVKAYGVTEGFLSQPPVRVGEGITGTVVHTRKPFLTSDVRQSSLCKNVELAELEGIRALICVPMNTRDSSIGCITVYRRTTEAFADHELLLLSIFSSEAVQAVEKGRMLSELRKQATLDPLTGLYNKKALLDRLTIETDRAHRNNQPMAVLFLDLDGLKGFNDTHGHLMGDKLIHDFTQILKQHSRKIDVLGRFGGDEFVIVAPQTDEVGAARLATKLVQAVAEHEFISSHLNQPFHATCSVGVARLPDNGANSELLLEAADAALYESKRQGKNRVTFASLPGKKVPLAS